MFRGKGLSTRSVSTLPGLEPRPCLRREKSLIDIGFAVEASLSAEKVGCHREDFNGECSTNEINRLVEVARSAGCDLIISAGGGT